MNIEEIETYIGKVPDFPKPGILYYDISSLLINGKAFTETVKKLCSLLNNYDFDTIAAIDARGFIFGSAVANKLNIGMVMIRKKNKLPGKTISHDYQLEYGNDTLEINVDANNKRIILIDDLLATGGTAKAAIDLIEKAGGKVKCFTSVIELNFLKGREKLKLPIESLIKYD
jgi:adenine phosphoribosyltransferase